MVRSARSPAVRFLPTALLCLGTLLHAQVRTGELRLHIDDPAGASVKAQVELAGAGNQLALMLTTDNEGLADFGKLPYGFYMLTVKAAGFASAQQEVEVRSPIVIEQIIHLAVAAASASVQVNERASLLDPYRTSSVSQIGSRQVEDRVTSLPGRSIEDLVNSQPGWLYEGNAVLHPRGSEYQTQFVVDGVPLTDNRSPSSGPELEADDVASLSIYTAGFPAEYGRKLGGVVELNTRSEPRAGLHGELELSGGSYATAQSFGQLTETVGRDSFGVTASGSRSSHYLNPVVPDNFTNNGTTGDFSGNFGRELNASDRLFIEVRHELSRFEIPNELVQEQAGQLQTGDNFETIGTVTYQHTLLPKSLLSLSGFGRNNSDDLYSNARSTPIIATQHNYSREGYLKGTYFKETGRHQFKFGVEADNTALHENFMYTITDPTQFDGGTPAGIAPYLGSRLDLEQAAFAEDLIRLGNYTINAGLRWDHYQLLTNQNAFSPRLSLSRYFPSANLVVHASYDRIFQTPSNENILISSSRLAQSFNPESLGLPVLPSHGNYYEAGVSALVQSHLRADFNYFRRNVNNYADDDQLLNTGVSYPIAFRRGILYGAEAKLQFLDLHGLSGFASYSYIVGNVFVPVTGGLFLGDDATNAITQLSGHFPDSQDQRNSLRMRLQYQPSKRFWVAAGLHSDSGLPFQFDGDREDALSQYGPSVISRLNFNRGRVDPSLTVNASASYLLVSRESAQVRFQADGTNLNNQLDVIDFGGLFSGNAIGPGRSAHLRLTTTF